MRKTRILVAESFGFPLEAYNLLRQDAEVVLADLDRRGIETMVRDAEVLWVRLRHQVDTDLLKVAPRLETVATPTTGLNHVDTAALERRGIRLLSLRGETEFLKEVRGTAEYTIGLILALLRHIPAAVEHARGGGWNRDLFQGSELFGKNVGIVGYGRLGRIVARYARTFEARVLACDPAVPSDSVEEGVLMVPLDSLLRQSDIVSLHVSLTSDTRQFFGSRQFERMKQGSCLVNTARGELVDEAALLANLRSGRLAGAALDVVTAENPAGMEYHPVIEYARRHPNLIVTPHLGGCTAESMHKTEVFLARKLWKHIHSAGSMTPAV
jgi:D-3-phosphoglycerate dehydrogenase / 2-oxoglutarate reductase